MIVSCLYDFSTPKATGNPKEDQLVSIFQATVMHKEGSYLGQQIFTIQVTLNPKQKSQATTSSPEGFRVN
jgi:hypothetical protein